MGRKGLLTIDPSIGKRIIDAISMGNPDKVAYESAGVGHEAYYLWLKKGTDQPAKDGQPGRTARSPYKEFAEGVTRARSEFIRNHVALVTHAAQGTVITHYAADGKTVASVERKNDGDWRASKWLLSVRDPANFSERHILEQHHSGPDGKGPILVGDAVAVATVVQAMSVDQIRALANIGTDDLAPEEEGGERG